MFMSGFVLICGIAFIFLKLKRRTMLWLLSHHLAFDVGVTVLMTLVHWGTFSGLMAAAFAGMLCSIFTTGMRHAFGYIKDGKVVLGKFVVKT